MVTNTVVILLIVFVDGDICPQLVNTVFTLNILSFLSLEPHHEKTGLRGFPTWSDTNQTVQPQNIA